jgi:NTP pyrophosphatase (non-canonical NTP hydrolase)
MEFQDLKSFIEAENERLREQYTEVSEQQNVLVQTVKISEELGELCDEVLAHDSLQRTEKLDEFENGNIESEFADVIITTLLLADSIGVDIESALEQKIENIERRHD